MSSCKTNESTKLTGDFISGVDLSYLDEILESGGYYSLNNKKTDIFEIMSKKNIKTIRLRLWHNPTKQWNNLDRTLIMAKKIKDAGLDLLLDFHYSDWWADPSNQKIPNEWENYTLEELKLAIYDYTFDVLIELNKIGVIPTIVQIGNEISSGMLWDFGKISGSNYETVNWINFTDFLSQASMAVRNFDKNIKIIVHTHESTNLNNLTWFFDGIKHNNVDYDIIGLSYYHWWANPNDFTSLTKAIKELNNTYKKDIMVVETSYPFTLDWNDNKTNIFGGNNHVLNKYPASPSGQAEYLQDLINAVKNGNGKAVLWWAAEKISISKLASELENVALFDFNGNALPALDVFKKGAE